MAFCPLGNSDHAVVSASIDFTWNSNDHFHRPAYDYSRADLDGPLDNSKGFSWEGIFKLGASDNVIEFCELVQVEIDVYIPQRKYWSSLIHLPIHLHVAAADGNHFFRLYQQNKTAFKVKFRQAKNHCENVLNPLGASVASYRNQSIDLLCKSIEWFLYEGNNGT